MFGWMEGFAKIERCWNWRFQNVMCVLVLPLRYLSVEVLRMSLESHIDAGFVIDQD